ncbi:MAG: DUF167 domain-containing protein [Rhodopirellula sp.]|nr:DUF167 domain-containing protein [Rhodopirellula sp.]
MNGVPELEIRLVQTESGIVLPVKAQAGARKNGITGEHDGQLKVAVTQAPEKGKANAALAKVIANELGLKKSQVELGSGATSTSKSFVITGIEFTELNSRLQARLES